VLLAHIILLLLLTGLHLLQMDANSFIFQRDVLNLTFDELGRLYEQGNT
jgi:hypothetical protein